MTVHLSVTLEYHPETGRTVVDDQQHPPVDVDEPAGLAGVHATAALYATMGYDVTVKEARQ